MEQADRKSQRPESLQCGRPRTDDSFMFTIEPQVVDFLVEWVASLYRYAWRVWSGICKENYSNYFKPFSLTLRADDEKNYFNYFCLCNFVGLR